MTDPLIPSVISSATWLAGRGHSRIRRPALPPRMAHGDGY
jgi:hypothetical protein